MCFCIIVLLYCTLLYLYGVSREMIMFLSKAENHAYETIQETPTYCEAQWRCGAVALWRCGAVAQWRCGAVALWRSGAVAQWRCGAVALWRSG